MWFSRNKKEQKKEDTKCDGCGKMKVSSEFNKTADNKSLCKECTK